MIKLSFLGGANEVGRSAVLFSDGIENFLLDYGIDVQECKLPLLPELNISAVFLSHAHLDHSGMVPELYKRGFSRSVYATPATFSLCSLLLPDLIKVHKKKNLPEVFTDAHVRKMYRHREEINAGEHVEFAITRATFLHAGHVPGSASIFLETKDKSVLYTGDIKFTDTRLMKAANIDVRPSVIISEATYWYKEHPERKRMEDSLKKIVKETVENNEVCVVACFAVGRTQEVLLMLKDVDFPLYIDGMGKEATSLVLKHPESIKDASSLRKAFGRARKVRTSRDRNSILKEPCVIITTSGMLNGGPVVHYIKKLYKRGLSSLVLTGYQVEGTAGRKLLDTGYYENEGVYLKPEFRLEFLDMSAHTDRKHLIDFYRKMSPEKIILVHGENIEEFKKYLEDSEGFDVEVPKNGDTIIV